MNFTLKQANITYKILREAEMKISDLTGKCVEITLREKTETAVGSPQDMLGVIAEAIGMPYETFREATRRRSVVLFRRVGIYMVRMHYPAYSLKDIGLLFDQDHTSIIHAISAAKNSIQTEDEDFMRLFQIAQDAVSDWINQ